MGELAPEAMTRAHRRFLLTARRVLAEAESLREMLAGLQGKQPRFSGVPRTMKKMGDETNSRSLNTAP